MAYILFFVFYFVFLKLMELKLTVDGLEKERDFYFSKLRDIELICQEHETENDPIISRIIDILYATEVLPMTFLYMFFDSNLTDVNRVQFTVLQVFTSIQCYPVISIGINTIGNFVSGQKISPCRFQVGHADSPH